MDKANALNIAVVTPCRKCGKPVYTAHPEDIVMCKECWDTLPRHKPNVPEVMKWEVFHRDGYVCQKCGTYLRLTVDHIKPEYEGGETVMENLQTLCKSCNSKKGHKA